jgi:hypothetical protein
MTTEHKIVRGTANPLDMEELLNEAADDGWELVSCPRMERPDTWHPAEDPYLFTFILRRSTFSRQL